MTRRCGHPSIIPAQEPASDTATSGARQSEQAEASTGPVPMPRIIDMHPVPERRERDDHDHETDDDRAPRLQWSLRSLRADFQVKNSEHYFKRYQARLASRLFAVALLLNLAVGGVDLLWFSSFEESRWPDWVRGASLLVYVLLLLVHWRHRHGQPRWLSGRRAGVAGCRLPRSRALAAWLLWLAMVASQYAESVAALLPAGQPPRAVRPPPLLFFLILCNETLVPFRSRILIIGSSALLALLELLAVAFWTGPGTGFSLLGSDMLFYLVAGLVAFYMTYLLEIVNRRAFLDHRKCVESKFKLTFEREQQERLLASCLPRHLMTKVRDDIRARFLAPAARQGLPRPVDGNNNDGDHPVQVAAARKPNPAIGPFRELYIDKWPDVTVLYADIVNSMALTQRLQSPKALVETLNALFCRFDARAERHDCLRIKILGDCYYCISGIPEHGPRHHATNCLLMGLDMIDIIQQFRRETGFADIDMRIGIHTGMVLSGLLGRKKWQFDIWSHDAMKASLMEQLGRPGYVHVTRATLNQIRPDTLDLLAVEPCRALPQPETTYLIRWRESRHHQSFDPAPIPIVSCAAAGSPGVLGRRRRPLLQVVNSLRSYGEMIRYSNDSLSKTIDMMSFNLTRQYDIRRCSIDINPVFLFFVLPATVAGETPVPKSCWQQLRRVHRIDCRSERRYFRQIDHLFPYYLIGSLVLAAAILTLRWLSLAQGSRHQQFWFRDPGTLACYLAVTISLAALAYSLRRTVPVVGRMAVWATVAGSLLAACLFDLNQPWPQLRYHTQCCTLALASISLFIRINLWLKLAMSSAALVAMASLGLQQAPGVWHLRSLFVAFLMFHVLDRQIEYISRLDFLWAAKLDRERREARLMREVNQLLLENMLPVHVAHRFLNNPEQQASHLYYEPYDSCAVMFAAIPNFFKFYRETRANDHGLYYLCILNDIICEFDKLLTLAPFRRRIEKIKTIGSTYMAAAGLQPGRGSIDQSSLAAGSRGDKESVANLVTLIRFAMSMMATLARLNGALAGPFQLRVGISMGPVIAGVVGALKPQYDIWGDTVNVASRMDTGGLPDKIQLPGHVAQLLLASQSGFRPYSRGLQQVKGKGWLETFLIDYDPGALPAPL